LATQFVQKCIKEANGKVWIRIIKAKAPKGYDTQQLQFKKVVFELFPQTIKPMYPKKSQYKDADLYNDVCNAINWKTATEDIKQQRKNGIKGKQFIIEGEFVKKRSRKKISMFIESAPSEIKALEFNEKRMSSPLWPKALRYINPDYLGRDDTKYKIIRIEEATSCQQKRKQ
jgi:hypothetical protein